MGELTRVVGVRTPPLNLHEQRTACTDHSTKTAHNNSVTAASLAPLAPLPLAPASDVLVGRPNVLLPLLQARAPARPPPRAPAAVDRLRPLAGAPDEDEGPPPPSSTPECTASAEAASATMPSDASAAGGFFLPADGFLGLAAAAAAGSWPVAARKASRRERSDRSFSCRRCSSLALWRTVAWSRKLAIGRSVNTVPSSTSALPDPLASVDAPLVPEAAAAGAIVKTP